MNSSQCGTGMAIHSSESESREERQGGSASVRTVKSADRTTHLLEVLARSPCPLSLTELQRELDWPKSSLYMLLQTLVARGWLQVEPRTGAYGVGVRALLAGTAYLDHDPVVQAASPVMSRLRLEIDETIHLARIDGADMVYLASRESQHHPRIFSRVGRRLPVHATSLGKALLAVRTVYEVDALLPLRLPQLTENTVTDRNRLHQQLALFRERGYAFEREENSVGLCCFAVALPYRRPAFEAISCSVPVERLDAAHERRVVGALLDAAREITQNLRRNGA
ncbi:MAG TPA: IclR family transcriptional regulator [Pseudoxanthomonas sp.]|nr:IclR family transcriptional regulator [Pseudoxanthomonas sp.]